MGIAESLQLSQWFLSRPDTSIKVVSGDKAN